MRVAEPPPGDRFFARILRALLECPACGFVDAFHWRKVAARTIRHRKVKARSLDPQTRAGVRAVVRREERAGWDPQTGTWRCPQCARRFVLGLLAWPVSRGGVTSRPRDQVPGEAELAQLRGRLSGVLMGTAIEKKRASHSNVTAGCTCKPGTAHTNQRDRTCPLHGDEETPT